MRRLPDRVRQVTLFELIGILIMTPPFAWASGEPLRASMMLIALLSLMAACWNGVYCSGFDWVEGRLTGRRADQRPRLLRLAHALGFEGGLLLLTLPVIMAWTRMNFWRALMADLGLALAYVGYAYLFNLAYDRIYPIASKR
jgi:uncharacterized membrane protein